MAPKRLCYIPVMLADSYIVPECLFRPGTLGGLISLYESNFIKLTALLGDVTVCSGQYVSRSARDCDLHLSVEDGSRYTRLLHLTYVFEDPAGLVAEPDLTLRLYLDARVAEVTGLADVQRHDLLARLAQRYTRELDRRWARNMVLGKWLDYLLDNGHSYAVNPAR
jgi:uncharacterized protein YqiB (DUF1249 family)